MRIAVAIVVTIISLSTVSACGRSQAAPVLDPAKLSAIQHALVTDLNKLNSDLRRERADVAAGPNGAGEQGCYNLVNSVDYDVVKTVDHFVQDTVAADRNNMQHDIKVLRLDIKNFQRDIADFRNDGVPKPAGASAAIGEITTKINQQVAAANRVIDHVNAGVRQAYVMADRLASQGGCPPSDRPEHQLAQPLPIPHVS